MPLDISTGKVRLYKTLSLTSASIIDKPRAPAEASTHLSEIMKLIAFGVLLAVAVVSVNARPRYIAVPLDDVQLLEVADYQRPAPTPIRVIRRAGYADEEQQAEEDGGRFQRGAHGGDGHDHVDYGAHTGHHGAFGWYADFPVHVGH